jgi:hypothetical protein
LKFSHLMIDWNFDKMSRIVGMNFFIRAKTPCRSLTDIHLMDRQNEGIEGYDPARHGRFAAGDHVDTNGRDTEKMTQFHWYTQHLPLLCSNALSVQMACFEESENLRMSEKMKEKRRFIKEELI